MNTRRSLLTLLVATAISVAGGTALGVGPGVIQLAQPATQLPSGDWEYIYDVVGDDTPIVNLSLSDFDAASIVNQWSYSWGGQSGTLVQHWDYNVGHNPPSYERDPYGSYSTDTINWTLHGQPWSIDNPWHGPGEYSAVSYFGNYFPKFIYPGKIAGDGQSLTYTSQNQNQPVTGLQLTFRIVHPNAPTTVDWSIFSFYGSWSGTVSGPGEVGVPGDFDGDGDIDTDDIDVLCDNLGDAAFDLDGDGDADEDDMTFLIEYLVELTDGSGRNGTQRGDFDLNGLINATDLATMNASFGFSGKKYGEGNANCDDLVNATDLAILAANFGYIAPAGAVPEPITLSLLAIGGLVPILSGLRRRK